MAARSATERLSNGEVAILSIHPPYAAAILAGVKHVELRKTQLRARTTHVAIYATSPVQRLVGVFQISHVDVAAPRVLWSRYAAVAGVDRKGFDQYYCGRDVGVAIGIADVTRFETPLQLEALEKGLRPPQNVVYLDGLAVNRLETLASLCEEPASLPRSAELVTSLAPP